MTTRREFHATVLGGLLGAGIAPLAACSTAPLGGTPVAVDCHAHVFLRDLPMPDKRRAPSGYDASPEDYLKVLDNNGMTHAVVVQPSFLGTDNSYLVAALKKYPDRLRGIAVVDPSIAVSELDAMQGAGVVGIRLNLIGLKAPDFFSPAWRQLLRELKLRNWQVEVHQLAGELKTTVSPLLDAGLNVVIDHFGRPDAKLGVEDPGFQYLLQLGPGGQTYVKLSGAYRNGANGRGEQIASMAIPLLKSAYGVKQLVWGSDWPHTLFENTVQYKDQRSALDQWFTDRHEREAILRTTPLKLFHFH